MPFEPRFAATAIGSLPHSDVGEACRLMLDNLPEAPVWPQLCRRSFLENMYVQYSEGLPGVRLDAEAQRIWFETDGALSEELEQFYTAVIAEDLDRFAMSEEYAAGLAMFTGGTLAGELAGRQWLKGQVTGPISFGLTVTDRNRRASLYDETLEQAIVQGLTLKARWQCERLREAAPQSQILLFVDEPYLVSVGSALISVSKEQVLADIGECVKGSGADLTGLHCCGNTDWSLAFQSGVDVVNFDAYDYLEEFIAYDSDIGEFLDRGGAIAWGVVPNDERVLAENAEGLAAILEGALDTLAAKGVDRQLLASRSMVTPACGLGSATEEQAEKALALNLEVAGLLRERCC